MGFKGLYFSWACFPDEDLVGGGLAIYNHSGGEVPYKCWSPGQPDDGNGEYKCTAKEMVNYEALWLMDCNTSFAYVCEKP